MEPFIFFSYGLTKSGSTLAFQLARAALERAGFPQPVPVVPGLVVSRSINAIEHVSEAQAEALLDAVRRLGHPVVLKTHTRPDPAVARLIEAGHARAHAILRDPRDVALSMLDHGRRSRANGKPAFSEIGTLADAVAGIDNQLVTAAAWMALPGVRRLTYDRLAFDTGAAAADILDHLGLAGDPRTIATEVLESCFTQFNKGVRDRHLEEMDAATSASLAARYAAFLALLAESTDPPRSAPLHAPVDIPARQT
ncbi:hypothetical protein HMH01_08645 [Halovulum dunhuangense]|uniref:Sulfotransferase domain-containing protein n=1 Tax=Halovulum dunhuangense TaxID=1505036 RepID=A0A849L2R7_9RHOB|nr:sulfotransferase domain-containing protein [Halovulum dunhuangense]NNU80507.1 hypothetical protein [Halovulum dunhuangense]